jgi:hypothetical protein
LGIPTYERILFYQPGDIAAADYRMLDSVECIYVETAPDDGGFVERCWVSVQSGLLCAAERTQDGALIYRMSAMEYETGTADAEAFVLPDGTQVYDPQNTADVTGKD